MEKYIIKQDEFFNKLVEKSSAKVKAEILLEIYGQTIISLSDYKNPCIEFDDEEKASIMLRSISKRTDVSFKFIYKIFSPKVAGIVMVLDRLKGFEDDEDKEGYYDFLGKQGDIIIVIELLRIYCRWRKIAQYNLPCKNEEYKRINSLIDQICSKGHYWLSFGNWVREGFEETVR
jgi:hypothetical protein